MGFATLFDVGSLVFYFGGWPRLGLVVFMGLFVGLVGAPELDPNTFKYAWAVQLFGGAAAGSIGALLMSDSLESIVPGAMMGGLPGSGLLSLWAGWLLTAQTYQYPVKEVREIGDHVIRAEGTAFVDRARSYFGRAGRGDLKVTAGCHCGQPRLALLSWF